MPDKFSQRVHLSRWNRRWSLRDLSKASGISISTLSRIERGNECDFSVAWLIAKALSIDLADVVPDNVED